MTHGISKSRLYEIWHGIKKRCYCKTDRNYIRYGARGIIMCDEWKNDVLAFKNWATENGYDENAPRGQCTIDRIDVNGNYEPSNCRWVNSKEQAYNRRNNRNITYNGKTMSICQWADYLSIPRSTFNSRLNALKWDVEKVLSTPVVPSVLRSQSRPYRKDVDILQMQKDIAKGETVESVCEKYGINKTTFYRKIKKENKE